MNAAAADVEPAGRLHLDYGLYRADVRPLADNLDIRRARLGIKVAFYDDWSFKTYYEFADDGDIRPGDGGFTTVALEYDGWEAADITIGQFDLPFSLAQAISSNDTPFAERALPTNVLAPSRRMGIGLSRERRHYTISAMAFGSSINGHHRGRGAAVRATVAPIHSNATVVHFGIAAVTNDPTCKVGFSNPPEARVADVDFVDTGRIDAVERVNRFGLESAWRIGPVSAQAEWIRTDVKRGAGFRHVQLDGWYVATSWVLTGESRPYKHGRFKGIEPGRPGGAWELTMRYSRINLEDADIAGGKERNVTLGLNYYLNKHLRIMANYINVHSRRHDITDNPDIMLIRAQIVL